MGAYRADGNRQQSGAAYAYWFDLDLDLVRLGNLRGKAERGIPNDERRPLRGGGGRIGLFFTDELKERFCQKLAK